MRWVQTLLVFFCLSPFLVVAESEETFAQVLSKAKNGDLSSQTLVANFYEAGIGTKKNYREAYKWHKIAAERGSAISQLGLGGLYFYGDGVPQDIVYAHMWWNLAASNGVELAEVSRNQIVNKMTPDQISEAQRLARECFKKNYKKRGHV